MVHTIYLYDCSVGTSNEVRLQYPLEDSESFKKALADFEFSLLSFLSNLRYLFLKPVSGDNDDLEYSNLVVDCESYLNSCLVDYIRVFFKLRGFIG